MPFAQRPTKLLLGQLLALEVLRHQRRRRSRRPPRSAARAAVATASAMSAGTSPAVALLAHVGLAVDQVDDAREAVLRADRQLRRRDALAVSAPAAARSACSKLAFSRSMRLIRITRGRRASSAMLPGQLGADLHAGRRLRRRPRRSPPPRCRSSPRRRSRRSRAQSMRLILWSFHSHGHEESAEADLALDFVRLEVGGGVCRLRRAHAADGAADERGRPRRATSCRCRHAPGGRRS